MQVIRSLYDYTKMYLHGEKARQLSSVRLASMKAESCFMCTIKLIVEKPSGLLGINREA